MQDPKGELEPPVPHHITRKSYENEIAEDEGNVERQLQAEKKARWQAREVA